MEQYEKILDYFTDKDLMKIGIHIASLWGGECTEFGVEEQESTEVVVHTCIEHGEWFVVRSDIEQLREYGKEIGIPGDTLLNTGVKSWDQ